MTRARLRFRMEKENRVAKRQLAVVALGGHAFLQKGGKGGHDEHTQNARAICAQLMTLVERGYNLVITHGNGPQVGDLLLRNEATRGKCPEIPLDVLVAQTEGSLGYYLQQSLLNELRKRDIRRYVVTVVTQVVVDPNDPAFDNFTKPVGPFLKKTDAENRRDELGWVIGEDAQGRGWRRLVPSPRPHRVIQRDMVRDAVETGHIVVAAGGGGIPVCKNADDDYDGIEAVIDKDLTSSVLASDVHADLLLILTAVDGVSLHFGTDHEMPLGAVTLAECTRYIRDGHFPPGSMGPKVEAIYTFLQRGGRRGLITSPARLAEALDGEAGTHFVGKI